MQLGRLSSPPEPTDLVRVLNEAGGEAVMASLISPPPLHQETGSLLPEIAKVLSTGSVRSPRRTTGPLSRYSPGGTDTYP
jgi:hypothetical protein